MVAWRQSKLTKAVPVAFTEIIKALLQCPVDNAEKYTGTSPHTCILSMAPPQPALNLQMIPLSCAPHLCYDQHIRRLSENTSQDPPWLGCPLLSALTALNAQNCKIIMALG